VTASSFFDAADQAMQAWSQLWWWDPDLSLDVKCGDRQWRVGSGRLRAWQDRQKGGSKR
jgi:hypothetical protein